MLTQYIFQSILDLLIVAAIIIGLVNDEKIADWESKMWHKLKGDHHAE